MNLRYRLPAALTAFVALFLVLPRACAAVTEAWVQRYSTTTGHSNDEAVKVMRDTTGDVILAGNSDEGTSGFDFLTIKHSGVNGAVLWQQRYNNPAGGSNNEDRVEALVTGDDASETADAFLAVEASTDLITWPITVFTWPKYFYVGQNTATSGLGVTIAENESAPDTITVAIPMGTDKTKFARLRIQPIP